MAKAGGVFGFRIDESGEAVVLPMLMEAMEDFDGGASDVFDVCVSRRPHQQFEDVVIVNKAVGYIVWGLRYGTGKDGGGAGGSYDQEQVRPKAVADKIGDGSNEGGGIRDCNGKSGGGSEKQEI